MLLVDTGTELAALSRAALGTLVALGRAGSILLVDTGGVGSTSGSGTCSQMGRLDHLRATQLVLYSVLTCCSDTFLLNPCSPPETLANTASKEIWGSSEDAQSICGQDCLQVSYDMHRPSSLYSRHQPCKCVLLLWMPGCCWVSPGLGLRARTSALKWYQQQSSKCGLVQL